MPGVHLQVRQCCLGPAPLVAATELAQTLETVGKLAQLNAGSSGGAALLQLVDQARATAR